MTSAVFILALPYSIRGQIDEFLPIILMYLLTWREFFGAVVLAELNQTGLERVKIHLKLRDALIGLITYPLAIFYFPGMTASRFFSSGTIIGEPASALLSVSCYLARFFRDVFNRGSTFIISGIFNQRGCHSFIG